LIEIAEMKKSTIIICFLAKSNNSLSQAEDSAIKIDFGKRVQFTSADSMFTIATGGRIQSLFEAKSNITNEATGADFLLRRCRLNIQGIVFNPQFTCRIQLGFAHGDITSGNSVVQNNLILGDAILFYKPNKWFRVGFGQTKLPGNRQRQISSANLQLLERSIANNNFTLDRDKGIWLYTNFDINKTVLKSTRAISSGEDRIVSAKNGKLSYAARLEFLPRCEFTKAGDYVEADIEIKSKPKLAIASVYNFNTDATRTMAQLGDFLYNSETANIQYYGADLLFKYKGFSLESEFYNRNSDNAIITNNADSTQSNYDIAGNTFMIQAGYFVSKTNNIAIKYAQINPDKEVASIINAQKEYVIGFSHYYYPN